MFAETKKEVLVEYPINVVYDTLVNVFPVKYYKLKQYDDVTNELTVFDSFNPTFVMKITLKENTSNTTIISFLAYYTHALMDITEGGKQAIEMILEKLLNRLDKQPKSGFSEAQNSEIEIVNADNFVNTTKNKTHTLSIAVGYVLCILSILLPMISLINYDPEDIMMFTFFIVGILSLAMEISLSVILQYYEDSRSILHGRIQLCVCGITLILMGIRIHPSLAIAGIIIPTVVIIYFIKREKSVE